MSDLRPPKPLLIRADAGGNLGIGHVMRMWALAQAYRDRGGAVCLVAATCPQRLKDRIEADGVTVRRMTDLPPGSGEDAEQTAAIALNLGAGWAAVDGYHFGTDYQRALRSRGLRVLAVDDYGHCETWSADAVLNQNIYAPERTLKSEVPDCRFLKGLRYALLRREFRRTPVPHESPAIGTSVGGGTRLLVTLGGVDAENATGRLLALLDEFEAPPRQLRVVVGPGNPNREELMATLNESSHRIEVLYDVQDMAPHYRWATHIISAGGSTCWEWLCLRKRALVVALAANQEPIVAGLTRHGLAERLPWAAGGFTPEARCVLERYFEASQTSSIKPPERQWVDGKGGDRVAALLHGNLRICIATAAAGWMNDSIKDFAEELGAEGHNVSFVSRAEDIPDGDLLFLLSFWGIVPESVLARNTHNLVVHASALPKGRGWSPLTWQILEGAQEIPVVLLEAESKVDSGQIYDRETVCFGGHELLPELRHAVTEATFNLCRRFVRHYPESGSWGRVQEGESSYYPRRDWRDSRIQTDKSIAEQFNLLRTVDNDAYPAFFDHCGRRYLLRIEKDQRAS